MLRTLLIGIGKFDQGRYLIRIELGMPKAQ